MSDAKPLIWIAQLAEIDALGAFLIVVAALTALMVTRWLSASYGKRGEIAAISKNLEEVLSQLAASTRIAEQIRAEIAFQDWRGRERFLAQKEALHQMMSLISQSRRELSAWYSSIYQGERTDLRSSALNDLRALIMLYHDHLEPLYAVLDHSAAQILNLGHDLHRELDELPKTDLGKATATLVRARAAGRYQELLAAASKARAELEGAIQVSMGRLLSSDLEGQPNVQPLPSRQER